MNTTPSDRVRIWLFVLAVPVLIGVFLLEVYTSILETVAYIPVILFMLWTARRRLQLVLIGLLGTLFLIVGYLFSDPTSIQTALLINRVVAVLVVWLSTFFAIRYKRNQASEKRQRSQLDALFNNATEAIVITNSRGEILMANLWAQKLFGYTQPELIGSTVEMLIPDHYQAEHQAHRTQFLRHPQNRPMGSGNEFFAKKKDGTSLPVDVSLSHFSIDDELFLVAFILDVTESKKSIEKIKQLNESLETRVAQRTRELTEALHLLEDSNVNLQNQIQERKKTEEKLNSSQTLYNAMTHNFPDGWIGVLDRELTYLLADGKELAEIGLTSEKLVGNKITDLMKPVNRERMDELLHKAFRGEQVSFDINCPNKIYNINAVPLPTPENSEVLVVIRNVTERTRYEEGLRKALEKEKELGELKSRFVTLASHEFRTPLTTILSSAFLLESYSGEKLETTKTLHIDRIKRSAKVLTEILNDFLSLGKLDEGKVKPVLRKFEFTEFMEEVIHELEPLKQPGQSIAFHHTGDSMVWSDQNLLRNITNNLISNAIKYSTVNDRIEIESRMCDNTLNLTITDHGMGIPEEDRKHIFKRFHRANNASHIQGTGLGLNIVKKYVRLLGGTVSFDSKINEGSTFTILIPVKENFITKSSGL